MTEQDQIRALAELGGWEYRKALNADTYAWFSPKGGRETDWFAKTDMELFPLNYLASYDAIIPLIQKQDMAYVLCLWDGECPEKAKMVVPTPSQLCEALLRATGKWKE